MNTLFNALGEEIPARPVMNDAIRIQGAKNAIAGGLGCISDGDDEEEIEAFVSAIAKCHPYLCDGYELAKDMEWEGFDVDRSFVDDMDDVCDHISTALRNAVIKWGKEHCPVPPFEIGTELKVDGFDGIEYGIIEGIYEATCADYLVKMRECEHGGHRVIKFEEAVKNEQEA